MDPYEELLMTRTRGELLAQEEQAMVAKWLEAHPVPQAMTTSNATAANANLTLLPSPKTYWQVQQEKLRNAVAAAAHNKHI